RHLHTLGGPARAAVHTPGERAGDAAARPAHLPFTVEVTGPAAAPSPYVPDNPYAPSAPEGT
ncbi:hypothetical protein ACWFRN_18160, partial [Streptomyces celluloflavus]